MDNILFRGACTALITPFDGQGGIDYDAFDRLLDRQLQAGIQAVVVCGTTGEASAMSDMEKLALMSHTVRYVHGRCRVLGGTGSNNTAHGAELSAAAAQTGVDALLVVTPYYNKCTQEGLVAHYAQIKKAAGIPVIAYNVPSRTGVDIAPQTCRALWEAGIAGLKEANPDASRVSQIRSLCPEGFPVWCGNDDRIVPFMAAGAQGVISVLSNPCPALLRQITDACLLGDYAQAARHQAEAMPLIAALFAEVNPIPVKAAMELLGQQAGQCRLPLTAASGQTVERLKQALQGLGLYESRSQAADCKQSIGSTV